MARMGALGVRSGRAAPDCRRGASGARHCECRRGVSCAMVTVMMMMLLFPRE